MLKIISYFGIFVAGFLAYGAAWETFDFIKRPEVYHQVYHFGESSFKWKHSSDFVFILSNLITSLISVCYISGSLIYLFRFKQNKKLRYSLLLIEISTIFYTGYWYYQWYLIGFDHF